MHLRMLHSADREARRLRYETLDPNREQQSIGYAYLTDPANLTLQRITAGSDTGRFRPRTLIGPAGCSVAVGAGADHVESVAHFGTEAGGGDGLAEHGLDTVLVLAGHHEVVHAATRDAVR